MLVQSYGPLLLRDYCEILVTTSNIPETPEQWEYHHEMVFRLITLFAAFFYFVRAYHDALYRAFNAVAGSTAEGSMGKAVKIPTEWRPGDAPPPFGKGPVAQILSAKLPGYATWFARFRFYRNAIKAGWPAGLIGDMASNEYQLGIELGERIGSALYYFNGIHPRHLRGDTADEKLVVRETLAGRITLSYLTEALRWSSSLCCCAADTVAPNDAPA